MNGNNGTGDVVSRRFFIYTLNFAAVAPAAQPLGIIQIQADSDFLLQALAHTTDIAGAAITEATRPLPLALATITDQGSGRFIMDAGVPIPSFFGDGRFPFMLPQPELFDARSAIGVQLNNYSAATTYNIRLAFIGTKIYRKSPSRSA